MTTQEMDTQEMTCTNVLEELGRIRDYHQGRADSAAILEDELKSLLGVAQATDEDPGAEPAVDPEPEPATEPRGASPAEPIRRSPRRSNSPPELGNISVDFNGTENLRERVQRVAEAAGGTPPDGGDPLLNRVGAAHRDGREPPAHRVPGLPGPGPPLPAGGERMLRDHPAGRWGRTERGRIMRAGGRSPDISRKVGAGIIALAGALAIILSAGSSTPLAARSLGHSDSAAVTGEPISEACTRLPICLAESPKTGVFGISSTPGAAMVYDQPRGVFARRQSVHRMLS